LPPSSSNNDFAIVCYLHILFYFECPQNPSYINGKRRGIWLSVLFAVRDEADWERVRASLAGCRQIAVIDDCRPRFQGQAVQQFHQHRLRQVLCLLRCEIPGAHVLVMKFPNVGRAA